jgi:hypothetical protein
MVLPYALYADSAPSRDDDAAGDVSYSLDCARGGSRLQSPQKLMPQIARTCVADIYFSEENIAALHLGIRHGVYKASNGTLVIGNQSRDELIIIMRSVYLQYSRNLAHNLLEQVRALNAIVLEWCVPRVTREAKMYQQYRHDSTTQPIPMEYGSYTSRAGMRGQH